jgi:hypothetical protein
MVNEMGMTPGELGMNVPIRQQENLLGGLHDDLPQEVHDQLMAEAGPGAVEQDVAMNSLG